MEYTQWALEICKVDGKYFVLILVVMEYTQWAMTERTSSLT